jgi:hypothetical protein
MNGASRFFQFLDAYPNDFVGCGYWTIAVRMHGNLHRLIFQEQIVVIN